MKLLKLIAPKVKRRWNGNIFLLDEEIALLIGLFRQIKAGNNHNQAIE